MPGLPTVSRAQAHQSSVAAPSSRPGRTFTWPRAIWQGRPLGRRMRLLAVAVTAAAALAMLVEPAAASAATGPGTAQRTAQRTAPQPAAPQPAAAQTTVTRSLNADLPRTRGWSGFATIGHERISRESAVLTDRLTADVMLVRRSCDVGGCMETVLRTEPGPLAVRWLRGMAGAASATTVPVRVRRYAVDSSGAVTDRILEDRLTALRLVIEARSGSVDLRTWYRSEGGGLATSAESLQAGVEVTVSLGTLRITTPRGTMSWSRTITRPLAG